MRGEELKKSAILSRALVNWQYADDWILPPLHFNISHTSSLIACAVTVGSPIGIDVEEKQRKLKNDILAFARRYFSPHEVEMLAHIVDPELRRLEFIKLWTLKEAYVKALGRGFSASPFNTFTIRLRDHMKGGIHDPPLSKEAEISVEPSGDLENLSSNWHFVLLELLGSHYASICIEKDSTSADKGSLPVNLIIRRTIPFVEDECISGIDTVAVIGGLSKLLNSIFTCFLGRLGGTVSDADILLKLWTIMYSLFPICLCSGCCACKT
ncbi:hypothetical protein TSUD_150980 [Trifolium subterraneum]|uniref:holo-[acyl-carrier-protein] synthase n=1 Tax=Trifolium subterraneum TaxID=3900 RepID=A0A2Z6N198_TRISU|nr:hypothetical protein TSUD_150980 [Trifolium subterraneum]